jgi:hypothetical protein
MSSGNPGSGGPHAVTNNYSDDEWVNTSDIGPEYEVATENFDVAAPAYSQYSSYPGNFFATGSGASIAQPTSTVYPTYSQNESQYGNSNWGYQEASSSTSFQYQRP